MTCAVVKMILIQTYAVKEWKNFLRGLWLWVTARFFRKWSSKFMSSHLRFKSFFDIAKTFYPLLWVMECVQQNRKLTFFCQQFFIPCFLEFPTKRGQFSPKANYELTRLKWCNMSHIWFTNNRVQSWSKMLQEFKIVICEKQFSRKLFQIPSSAINDINWLEK